VIAFAKAQALGNDFLIIRPDDAAGIEDLGSLARRMTDRRTGVGADGLILLTVEDQTRGIASFRIFNADGTEAEMSGNGLRCAAAYLAERRAVASPKVRFRTKAGDRATELVGEAEGFYTIKTDMGVPRLTSRDIPFDDGTFQPRLIDYPLPVGGTRQLVTLVSMGNPHCALFVDERPAPDDWHRLGREIEAHPSFPRRTNVEFVRVIDRQNIEVFFWERGVGETLSSGTGACGAAVAAILKGRTDRTVRVRTRLGILLIEWAADAESVFQTGPAGLVFTGTWPRA
jgi:diaminopimelate epimerase